jgi:glycosyltransferase involved in cell wall biosynthesis
LRLERGFNVVFAGNLGTLQALDTILAAAQLLRNDPQVRFVLVGSGSRGAWVHDEIKRLGLTNVNMPGRYQQEQMSGILSQASALLVTLVPNPVTSQTIPSKIQSYLAVGRPIIASLDGEGARVIEESDSGIACPAGDATALARAVEDLRARSAPELTRLGENGRRYYQQHFEPMLLAERLKQRFTALRDSRAHADSTHD